MSKARISERGFSLLAGLHSDGSREWFREHKAAVREHLLEPFAQILEECTRKVAGHPWALKGGSETMFRMNRDVRFSRDKSPYKDNVSGLLTADGSKTHNGPIFYLQLEPSGGFMALGLYKPPTNTLNLIRDRIVHEADDFTRVIGSLKDERLHLVTDEMLTKMPRGYESYADHEHAQHLKLKSYIVRRRLSKSWWTKGQTTDRCTGFMQQVSTLMRFLDDAVG